MSSINVLPQTSNSYQFRAVTIWKNNCFNWKGINTLLLNSKASIALKNASKSAHCMMSGNSVKFSTRFVGLPSQGCLKWALNQRNISYIVLVNGVVTRQVRLVTSIKVRHSIKHT
jgi:hypothetical protein